MHCNAGVCHYMNGSYFEGEWKAGFRHGRGMQQCADGSNYVSSHIYFPTFPTAGYRTAQAYLSI